MKNKKSPLLKLTKETPAARKNRIVGGVRLRAVTFEDKRDKLREKAKKEDDNN